MYKVVDQSGEKNPVAFTNKPNPDYIPGRKLRNPSSRLNSFTKQHIRDLCSRNGKGGDSLVFEDDLFELTPVRDHSKPRMTDWSIRKWRHTDAKCWKTRSKHRAQYNRHQKEVHKMPPRILSEEDIHLRFYPGMSDDDEFDGFDDLIFDGSNQLVPEDDSDWLDADDLLEEYSDLLDTEDFG